MANVILIAVVCGALAALLQGARGGDRGLEAAAKTTASVAFVVLGALRWSAGDAVATWLVVGLALCAVGDVLLLGERTFDLGLATFLLGHVAYLVAFHLALPIIDWPWWIALPPLVASFGAAAWLWPHLGRRRKPVGAYIAVITVMVWGAASVAWTGALPRIIALGALLFYLSDLTVARQRFVHAAFVNRAVGLPMYYAGQVLIALSIIPGA
jgi:uncharacterized membrane protein YhhN